MKKTLTAMLSGCGSYRSLHGLAYDLQDNWVAVPSFDWSQSGDVRHGWSVDGLASGARVIGLLNERAVPSLPRHDDRIDGFTYVVEGGDVDRDGSVDIVRMTVDYLLIPASETQDIRRWRRLFYDQDGDGTADRGWTDERGSDFGDDGVYETTEPYREATTWLMYRTPQEE